MTLEQHTHERLVVDASQQSFVAALEPGVWVKLLSPVQGDVSAMLVRCASGVRLPPHDHGLLEEVFVLDGDWCDERGQFGAGTYQLNPPRFAETPRTTNGCLLFMRVSAPAVVNATAVVIDTSNGPWQARGIEGVSSLALDGSPNSPGFARLTRLAPRTRAPRIELPHGEEIFVIDGSLYDEYGHYDRYTWLALPPGFSHCPGSAEGCLLYVRSGRARGD